MPPTKVLFYKDANGRVPALEWMDALRQRDRAAWTECRRAVDKLARWGHELRRPDADYLQNGIYELRVRCRRVHYRLLYFFHGQNVVIVAAAFTKEGRVPNIEIRRVLDRERAFALAPGAHVHTLED
jgi:phage-related protein